MIRVITIAVFFIVNSVCAQTQYEQGMQRAFGLWGEGKTTEASAMFERISAAENDNWLPDYYISLINTIEAFQTKDREKVTALLGKAQAAQDRADMISPNNPELMVMQAMIHTAWIAFDPMTNGMKLSPTVSEIYAKALSIAPQNPRVVFCKAEFEMGGAAYFKQDTTPMCAEIERAVGLFANFKPETPFHPNWGLERAQEKLKECGK